MSRIQGKNTAPERTVRSVVHRLGYRFRLHRADLPGHPDLTLPRLGAVILVHGCFWHRHRGCQYAYSPRTRRAFWRDKFAGNARRDRRVKRQLAKTGWRVIVVWECETHDLPRLSNRLEGVLRELDR
jgi:DNA mismatch endonuclease (patch repair protein)